MGCVAWKKVPVTATGFVIVSIVVVSNAARDVASSATVPSTV